MRALLIIVVLVVVLALVGWIRFSSPEGDPTIRVDSDKVKADTAVIVEKTKQAIDNTANKIEENTEPQGVTE